MKKLVLRAGRIDKQKQNGYNKLCTCLDMCIAYFYIKRGEREWRVSNHS